METLTPSDMAARLIHRWKDAHLIIRPGATFDQLIQFQGQSGAHLDPAIFTYFMAVNGMEREDMDPESHIRFWPLEEIKPLQGEFDAPWAAQYPNCYLFADYLLWSHGYAVDLGPSNQANHGRILLVGGESVRQVAGSFDEFLRLYLSQSERLF